MSRFLLSWILAITCTMTLVSKSGAQDRDTLQISLADFIQRGIENADKIDLERHNIRLAQQQVDKAEGQRILPKIQLSTQHGLVPGVESDSVLPGGRRLPEGRYYLDPDLENDWEDWAIFTRAEVQAIQPVFSWGAIDNAINAARAGARAAREKMQVEQADLRLRLFDLYYSYILILEIERLLDNAQNQINKIDEQIKKLESEPDSDIDQSDIFKFRVYRSRFKMRTAELKNQATFVRRTWSDVLQSADSVAYEPSDRFLDPLPVKLREIQYYKQRAVRARSEIQRIEAGIQAAKFGLEAQKSQALPSLFLGLTASFANTPNRPRQDNPFIINNTNYASAGFGIGIRQNLNFWTVRNKVKRQRIQYNKARSLKEAATEGIRIEINEKYKQASLSKANMTYTDEALLTSKKWLQQEKLDYDLGMGEVKDLVESLKTKLELEVEMKRRIYQFNKNMAELFHTAGIPLNQLNKGS